MSEASSLSSSLSSVASSVASAYATGPPNQSTTATSEAASAIPSLTPEQEAEQVQEKIANDLRNWQEKFAKAADKGTDDLQERVKDITDRQVERQVQGVGEALLVQLEQSSSSEIAKLKKAIIKIVQSIPEVGSDGDIESAEEDLSKATRSAGLAVKDKAQALRSWKQKYDEETHSLVSAASESTLEVIDNIRDLGLQEIGMRWAWMEGVTYKDWSKYHDMKKTFAEWRSEVETVAKDHDGLKTAKQAGDDVESRGMGTAEDTAKELSRLKEVGRWKIQARDASEDFSTKYVPAKAAAAGQKVMEKISSASESVVGTSQGSMESLASQASQGVADAATGISSQIVGTQPGIVEQAATKMSAAVGRISQPVHESVASVASEKATEATSKISDAASAASEKATDVTSNAAEIASGATSKASEMASEISSVASEQVDGFKLKFVSTASKASAGVVGTQQPIGDSIISAAISKASEAVVGTQQPMTASVVSAASKKLNQASSMASEQIIGTPAPMHESIASEASKSLHSAASAVSEAIPGSSTPVTENISSAASSVSSSASSVASKASQKVFAGAMAQRVEMREPVLDDVVNDDDTYSEKLQSMVSQAGDKYADITRAVSDALLQPTSTQGSVESITSIASEQYSRALAAASSVLYGTEQGTGESVMSVASGKYSEAVAA